MASSDQPCGGILRPAASHDVPGDPLSLGSKVLDKSAQMLQSLAPIKQFQQHVCTWAIYSHDMNRQIETHHYVARLNEDFLQCAVYDSDQSDARLIGVEYIISDRLFLALPDDEKKLWHSHYHEIKSGLWVNPGVPEVVQKQELNKLAKTYGKFWCTWQFDRGDRLPLGVPALMMSPQEDKLGHINPQLVKNRDERYNISSLDKAKSRSSITSPEPIDPLADYWKSSGKGFAIDLKEVDMALGAGFPLATLK